MYYQFVLPYLQSSSKMYSPMLIYMGITVVSVLPNTRGSTLGRKREHYSENKSVRSKSQEFSKNSREAVSVSTICDEYCTCVSAVIPLRTFVAPGLTDHCQRLLRP